MARSVIRGYDVLLIGDKKILADDAGETKVKGFYYLRLINKIAYNEMILSH